VQRGFTRPRSAAHRARPVLPGGRRCDLHRRAATAITFSGYSGYGIAEDAGYSGGYVTSGCIANGSITTSLTQNMPELTGGDTAPGISLQATGAGNDLTGTLSFTKGYVTSPSNGIEISSVAPPQPSSPPSCSPYSPITPGGASLAVVQSPQGFTSTRTRGPRSAAPESSPPPCTFLAYAIRA